MEGKILRKFPAPRVLALIPFACLCAAAIVAPDASGSEIPPSPSPSPSVSVSPSPTPSPSPSPTCTSGCTPAARNVSFTLLCNYTDPHNPPGFQSCTVSSCFTKAVTLDGGEIVDTSAVGNDPSFVVKCDNNWVYNNSAHRDTGLLGTLVQGESGPTPLITLDRGELHDGYHVGASKLLVNDGNGILQINGSCQIWATP